MAEKDIDANFGISEVSEVSQVSENAEKMEKTEKMEKMEKTEKMETIENVVEDKKNTQEILSKINTISDVYHISKFINLIEMLVKTDEIKTDITIKLNDKTRLGFLYIIKSNPEFFSDFEKTIILILADNKIDIEDLPYLTDLIIKLYEIIHSLKQFKYTNDEKLDICSTIIKFIIQVMVKERKINMLGLNENDFLEKIEGLIDSCIGLIKINKIVEGVKCGCFGFF